MQVFAGISPSFSGPNARKAWLVWLIDEANHASNEYVVDAATGKIISVIPKMDYAIKRTIYNAKETNKLPGTVARVEGGPKSEDTNVNEAYDGLEYAYNFYLAHFDERRSFDGQDGPLNATVHFAEKAGVAYENAYWNGQQLVFGNNYTKALDILGHELTHGVTENTSGLVMSGQPGALNEAFSDIIGTAIEAEKLENESKAINWEMGLTSPPARSEVFRNRKNSPNFSARATLTSTPQNCPNGTRPVRTTLVCTSTARS